MGDPYTKSVRQLLAVASTGNQEAVGLFPTCLFRNARTCHLLSAARTSGPTLPRTALIHDAYLRLIGQKVNWQNRAYCLDIAAQTMRPLLLDPTKTGRTTIHVVDQWVLA